MNSVQKVIKYLALAFAIFLSVTIIGGIITALAGVSYIFSGGSKEAAGEMQEYSVDDDISSLSLSLSGAELKIKTADKFSVESNHNYISVESENGQLWKFLLYENFQGRTQASGSSWRWKNQKNV